MAMLRRLALRKYFRFSDLCFNCNSAPISDLRSELRSQSCSNQSQAAIDSDYLTRQPFGGRPTSRTIQLCYIVRNAGAAAYPCSGGSPTVVDDARQALCACHKEVGHLLRHVEHGIVTAL
jgi:hypothetical protein